MSSRLSLPLIFPHFSIKNLNSEDIIKSKEDKLFFKRLRNSKSLKQMPQEIHDSLFLTKLNLNNSKKNSYSNNNSINSENSKKYIKIKKIKISKSNGELAKTQADQTMKHYLKGNINEKAISNYKANEIFKIMPLSKQRLYIKEKCKIDNLIYRRKMELKNSISIRAERKSSFSYKLSKSQINKKFIIRNIANPVYTNPLHSFNTIMINKCVVKDIKNNYHENNINSYKEKIKNLHPMILHKDDYDYDKNPKYYKYKYPQKIRISPFVPFNILMLKKLKKSEEDEEKEKKNKEKMKDLAKILAHALGISDLIKKKESIYLLKSSICYPNINFPESRVQFVFIQDEDKYYLQGGFCTSRDPSVWEFNPVKRNWTKLISNKDSDMIENRFGHTGIIWNKKLIIFGGKYNNYKEFCDLEIYDLQLHKWYSSNAYYKRKFELVKNHVACLVGNSMFINGGQTKNEVIVNKSYLLNLKTLKWMELKITNNDEFPSLIFHCCSLIIPKTFLKHPNFTIFKFPEIVLADNIKLKGIYIFGGYNGNFDKCTNHLYVLKIGKKKLEWTILKTTGYGPTPRISASMSFLEKKNLLIIHGGRTNTENVINPLNDTYLLDLETLNWLEVGYYGEISKGRYQHQSVTFNNELFIFGGTNGKFYMNSEMFIINLDSHDAAVNEKREAEIAKRNKQKKEHKEINFLFSFTKKIFKAVREKKDY